MVNGLEVRTALATAAGTALGLFVLYHCAKAASQEGTDLLIGAFLFGDYNPVRSCRRDSIKRFSSGVGFRYGCGSFPEIPFWRLATPTKRMRA